MVENPRRPLNEGMIIFQHNESTGRMEVTCRGNVGINELLNHLRLTDEIDVETRERAYQAIAESREEIGSLFSEGGIITYTRCVTDRAIVQSVLPLYPHLQETVVQKVDSATIPQFNTDGSKKSENAYLIAPKTQQKLGCEISERGAIIAFLIHTQQGPKVLSTGLEGSLINLIKRSHQKRNVDPPVAPKTLFKQILLDLIYGSDLPKVS